MTAAMTSDEGGVGVFWAIYQPVEIHDIAVRESQKTYRLGNSANFSIGCMGARLLP